MKALVTGAGGRLGRAMALYLAARGHDVAVHYHGSEAGAEQTAEAIRAAGRAAALVQADLLDHEATLSLVPRAAEALGGPLTVLVNSASIFTHDRLDSATLESWDRHIGSNLRAPVFLTQGFAAQLPEPETDATGELRAKGLVVNMVDQRVRKPTPEFMTYALAKMALWDFTRTAAQALAPRARVNAIGPGSTLKGTHQSAEQFSSHREKSLLQRGPNPEDITAALGYFLDAPAVTGQLICVDGGQHLNWKTSEMSGANAD